jgi:deaminated glutathione amidase
MSAAPQTTHAPVTLAAVQMVSAAQVSVNLASAARLIAQAADAGASLVALPEYFCLLGLKETDKLAAREQFGVGPIQDFLAQSAARHRIWLVGGTMPLDCGRDDKIFNTTLVFAPDGSLAARYDKIHLFGFRKTHTDGRVEQYDESRTIAHGSNAPVSFVTPFARVGLSVCYDLRFPELYRAHAGCELLLVPSAFTATTGEAHWEALLKARAIENLAYVLAPAQGGTHENGRRTHGHSMLVDPWGAIVNQQASEEGVVLGVFEPSRVTACRASLPALEHRTL